MGAAGWLVHPSVWASTGASESPARVSSGSPAAASASPPATPSASSAGIFQDRSDEQPPGRAAQPGRRAYHDAVGQLALRDAAEIYLINIADRREDSTYDTSWHWMDNVVLPALGQLRIHECNVAQLDVYFTILQRGWGSGPRREHLVSVNSVGEPRRAVATVIIVKIHCCSSRAAAYARPSRMGAWREIRSAARRQVSASHLM
jgi:hypothetical protein